MSAEEFAAEVARRVLNVDAEVWDVPPRQGAYDVRLTYPDGRVGAMEVTSHAAPGHRQVEALLGRDGFAWPLPGRWAWTIHPTDDVDLRWLRKNYARIILLCETHGAIRPDDLDPRLLPGGDWDRACAADMLGTPDVPAVDGDRTRQAMITPAGASGAVDEDLSGLGDDLAAVLDVPAVARRATKVVAAGADEAHLFLNLDATALSFPTTYALMTGAGQLPPHAPVLPAGLTCLWVVPRYAPRLLLWAGAWTEHRPYDGLR